MNQFDDENTARIFRKAIYRYGLGRLGVVFSYMNEVDREAKLTKAEELAKKFDSFTFFYKKRVWLALYIGTATDDEVSFSGTKFIEQARRTRTISHFSFRETTLTKLPV